MTLAHAALVALALGLAVAVFTGWPTYIVLVLVAVAVAGGGWLVGGIDAALLGALPARIVALLEHDLLQALALYALVAVLLRRGTLAVAMVAAMRRAAMVLGMAPRPAQALAGYAVGVLLAPMNGSVGASASMLRQRILPLWHQAGVAPAPAWAMAAATATLGVVVPPSVVLLLLGDAMLRAHTEGLALSGEQQVRVMNTQDLMQAVTPAALVLAVVWGVVVVWQSRRRGAAPTPAPAAPPALTAAGCMAPLVVLALLVLVAVGLVRAVEAAATAALAVYLYSELRGELRDGQRGEVFAEALALTGALFAPLLAATTLSLVLRAAGCDALVAQGLAQLHDAPHLALAAVLAGLMLLLFVLDAYEIIFLAVPIVMPPLLAQISDAAWVACLTLLVLQAGFLLPPWGYAVMLTRETATTARIGTPALVRALLPYLMALAAIAGSVAWWPACTRWLRHDLELRAAPLDTKSADELLEQMSGGAGRNAPKPGAP